MQMLLFYSILRFLLMLLKDCYFLLLLILILRLRFLLLIIIIVIGITMFELLLCDFDRIIQRQARFIRGRRCTAVQDIGPHINRCRRGVRESKCFGGFECGRW